MDMQEIKREINKLENGATTWNSCEKLSILYNVMNGMRPEQAETRNAYPTESEFVRIFRSIQLEDALNIIDEHMECVKAVYPKEYNSIIRKMRDYI